MPTQFGDAPKYVTLSGGWAYSISSRSQHQSQAFKVLQLANSTDLLAGYDVAAAQIAPRKDILNIPAYQNLPGNSFFTSLVAFSQFRPAFPAYPKISVQVDSAMQHVMQGQSPADAMSSFNQSVASIAGQSNIETHT
jgi:multiple sugar transport system substrate-binding protein